MQKWDFRVQMNQIWVKKGVWMAKVHCNFTKPQGMLFKIPDFMQKSTVMTQKNFGSDPTVRGENFEVRSGGGKKVGGGGNFRFPHMTSVCVIMVLKVVPTVLYAHSGPYRSIWDWCSAFFWEFWEFENLSRGGGESWKLKFGFWASKTILN